jgi:hypothetical protein
MRRPSSILLAILLSTVLACGPGTKKAPEAPRRLAGAAKGWNVILVTVDTLRADRLGAYDYKVRGEATPGIDAQLGSGVLFESAMAQRASTWPSLASLLTGLYPSGHGVAENGYGFPDGLPTLPKLGTRRAPSSATCARPTTRGGTPSPAPAARTARTCAAPWTG